METPLSSRGWSWVVAAILALDLCLIGATFRDYGMSCDQSAHYWYGGHVIRYLLGGADRTATAGAICFYGTTFELASHVTGLFFGPHWVEARNLTSALFGLLGVYAAARIGAFLFGPAVGATAALFLFLTPVYYGHQFINPKDLPFAALAVFSLWQMIVFCGEAPGFRFPTALKLSMALGFTLAMRIGGVLLFGALAGGLAVATGLRREKGRTVVAFGGIAVSAWLVMMAVWPFVRENPFLGPYEALTEFSKFPWASFPKRPWTPVLPSQSFETGWIFFRGHYFYYTDVPRAYPFALMLRTLPEFIWIGLLGWGVAALAGWKSRPSGKGAGMAALLLATGLPLLSVLLLHPVLYDGYRHLLFVIPPLVILAAAGAWAGGRALRGAAQAVWAGAIFISLLLTAADMRSLHPYEYVYFNRLIGGGLQKASRSYEIEYWATSGREAALWVKNKLPKEQGDSIPYFTNLIIHEFSLSPPPADKINQLNSCFLDYYLEDSAPGARHFYGASYADARLLFIVRRGREQADLPPGRLLYTVSRQGVPFMDVVLKTPPRRESSSR